MKLLNDYDLTINYHPGKANKVADALSRKSAGNVAMLRGLSKELIKEIVDFGLVIVSGKLSSLHVRSDTKNPIAAAAEREKISLEPRSNLFQ